MSSFNRCITNVNLYGISFQNQISSNSKSKIHSAPTAKIKWLNKLSKNAKKGTKKGTNNNEEHFVIKYHLYLAKAIVS